MYKIGDKVEYCGLVSTVVSINERQRVMGIVYTQEEEQSAVVGFDSVKPYRTAHEKLIEMGYELTKRSDYVFYRHDDLPRVTIYSDKTYSCSDTNLVLSRILTAYLEELHETPST